MACAACWGSTSCPAIMSALEATLGALPRTMLHAAYVAQDQPWEATDLDVLVETSGGIRTFSLRPCCFSFPFPLFLSAFAPD